MLGLLVSGRRNFVPRLQQIQQQRLGPRTEKRLIRHRLFYRIFAALPRQLGQYPFFVYTDIIVQKIIVFLWGKMSSNSKAPKGPIVIKKYANRRLYDTGCSSYVTLDDLCQMVKKNQEFVVYDAKTGEDLTRSVLTQIIVEQEGKDGKNLLPINFLRQLIGFYDNKFQGAVPDYLEQSLDAFTKHHEQFRDQMNKSIAPLNGMFPGLQAMEDMGKKNMAMFENAMRAMTPFPMRGTEKSDTRAERAAEVKRAIAALQRELDNLK
jgi:polyhydroxyalkanoate synthesis repressor PhaR